MLRATGRFSSRYPILLDYPLPPEGERWGWGSPRNRPLQELIAGSASAYTSRIDLLERFAPELALIPKRDPSGYEPHWSQQLFTGLDAAALYCFIRDRAPGRYHEIGSGNSTLFAARAIRDGDLSTRILSVDPQPRVEVDPVCEEAIRSPLELIDPERVASVEPGDVVLVDSSHYAFKGSDVVAFFLDVLPMLPTGVLVGIDDVFLPDDYPWWFPSQGCSEQYLLATWLLGAGERARLVFPAHFCSTEPSLSARLEEVWTQNKLPGLAYGNTFWFEV